VVVDPRKRIVTIHRPPGASHRLRGHRQTYAGSDTLDLGDVLPGFAPTVEDLLA